MNACQIETSALGANIGDLGAITVAAEGLKTEDRRQTTDGKNGQRMTDDGSEHLTSATALPNSKSLNH